MGNVTFGPHEGLVMALKEHFKLSTFVETGTFRGSTTRWASGVFDRVVTIEASKSVFDDVSAGLNALENVTSLFGKSPVQLHQLVPTLDRTMFWLDAHWCGELTAGETDECPLLAELSIIMPWSQNNIILIDDARLFLLPPPPPHQIAQWPSLDDIICLVNRYRQCFTCIFQDIILIVPVVHRLEVAKIIQGIL